MAVVDSARLSLASNQPITCVVRLQAPSLTTTRRCAIHPHAYTAPSRVLHRARFAGNSVPAWFQVFTGVSACARAHDHRASDYGGCDECNAAQKMVVQGLYAGGRFQSARLAGRPGPPGDGG